MRNVVRVVILALGMLLLPLAGWAGNTVGFLVPQSGLGDQSFNDMTYAGMVKAKNTCHFKLVTLTVAGESLHDRRQAMEELIGMGADVIVTNGWEFHPVIREYAPRYPEKKFLLNDFPVSGFPNVMSTVFAQHEASFLAGALASLMSETGRIGFIGGKDMVVIRAFLTGYREGAVYINGDIVVDTVFLSREDEPTSGFDDPARGFAEANEMYAKKVDIIFSVAGLAGNGVIRSAVKNDGYVIGVDADQDHMAKGHVLTSVMKRLDKATFAGLQRIFEGRFVPGVISFGLLENGVGLSPMTYTRDLIPQAVHQTLRSLKQKIIDGEIVVSNELEVEQ